MKTPAYRGALCHAGLAAIAADARHGPRVLASVDARYLEMIRSASKLAWIPAIAFDELNATYLREVGQDGYIDLWRRYAIGSVDTPLFGALFNGALRIFGKSPAGLLKWMGRAWQVTTRDYGRAESEIGPAGDVVRIRLLEIPRECRRITVPLSTQGSVTGVIEFTGHVPLVTLDVENLERAGRYEITARWTTRP